MKNNSVAIVTGASQGIGRSTAIRLARDFSAVVLAARSVPGHPPLSGHPRGGGPAHGDGTAGCRSGVAGGRRACGPAQGQPRCDGRRNGGASVVRRLRGVVLRGRRRRLPPRALLRRRGGCLSSHVSSGTRTDRSVARSSRTCGRRGGGHVQRLAAAPFLRQQDFVVLQVSVGQCRVFDVCVCVAFAANHDEVDRRTSVSSRGAG